MKVTLNAVDWFRMWVCMSECETTELIDDVLHNVDHTWDVETIEIPERDAYNFLSAYKDEFGKDYSE